MTKILYYSILKVNNILNNKVSLKRYITTSILFIIITIMLI